MSLIERARAAIETELRKQANDTTTELRHFLPRKEGEDWVALDGNMQLTPLVHAVLQTIREPSDSMIFTGNQYDSERGEDTWGGPQGIDDDARHTFEPNSRRIWRAMVDAVLEEQP